MVQKTKRTLLRGKVDVQYDMEVSGKQPEKRKCDETEAQH